MGNLVFLTLPDLCLIFSFIFVMRRPITDKSPICWGIWITQN